MSNDTLLEENDLVVLGKTSRKTGFSDLGCEVLVAQVRRLAKL